MSHPFTVTRAEARELKRRDRKTKREGAVPDRIARQRWLAALERDLRAMVRTYDGTARKGNELLSALIIAEGEGVSAVTEFRHDLLNRMSKLGKTKAA